jgi:hypothetical protein
MIDLELLGPYKKYYISVAVVILILIIYIYFRKSQLNELVGIYVAPADFLAATGIEDIVLILDDVTWTGVLSGYMLLGTVVTPIEINISWLSHHLNNLWATIWTKIDTPLPDNVHIRLGHGRLIIEDNEAVYIAADFVHA